MRSLAARGGAGFRSRSVGQVATGAVGSIAGQAVRAFAQPTLAQANRLFQQRLSFGSLGYVGSAGILPARRARRIEKGKEDS
ncbi:MAG: hypothetical protein [Olavius algarvensis Gamma 1 endosymbiont]|nr:MAG: hypothetical protein [Olavius algarvensis Gamma 1 endosymbiont]